MTGRLIAVVVLGIATGAAMLSKGASAYAEELPDLTISRLGPATVAAHSTFEDRLKVTNKGTAPVAGVTVNYEPNLSVAPLSKSARCSPILRGHSGRGGGYTQVGWSCSETLPKPLAPKGSTTIALDVTAPSAGNLIELLSVAPNPSEAQLNLVSHTATDTIVVFQPPLPGQPTGVQASRVGDRLKVSWIPALATQGCITQTQVNATPVGTTTAPPASGAIGGSGTSGTVGVVEPNVTYRISVISYDVAGASVESEAIEYTTPPSTVPPSAPVELRTWWLSPTEPIGTYAVAWAEPKPGDSPIDEYEIQAVPVETEVATTVTVYEPAGSTETVVTGNSETPWKVKARAHNAAGWGAWSATVERGGV
jgi:hypothetical protein